MKIKPNEIGLTREVFEQAVNMLIARYGYDKTIIYTMDDGLAALLNKLGQTLADDINRVLNAPTGDDNV